MLRPVSFKVPGSPDYTALSFLNTASRIINRTTARTFIVRHLPQTTTVNVYLPYLASTTLLVDPGKRKLLPIPIRAWIKGCRKITGQHLQFLRVKIVRYNPALLCD